MKTLSLLTGLALAVTLGSASAQKLTTLFAANNGGSAGGNVYFDIEVKTAVRITQFETNYSTLAPVTFNVYTCPSSSIGNEGNKSAWTMVGQDDGTAMGAGTNTPTIINLKTPIIMTPGKYGIAFESGGSGHQYTNGPLGPYQNADLVLTLGTASNVAFTLPLFNPRVWNGSFVYTPAKGLFTGFDANPERGNSPLTVQFTDATYTSAGPVTSWAWDFNGDNVIDSKVQNPKYTYTAKGWDQRFTVSLTTTDATHPASKLTKKDFITVNPSTATAIDYGNGSTNKPAPSPIGVSDYTYTYSAAAGVRGYFFVAPAQFIVNGFEAPNTFVPPETDQTITCVVVPQPPIAAFTPLASEVVFHATGKANTILRPTKPIIVPKGHFFGVLGACHAPTPASLLRNSYGNGEYWTTVNSHKIQIKRLWMNLDPRTNKGLGLMNPSAGAIGRVFVHVIGNTSVPSLTTIDLPKLGGAPKLDFNAQFSGAIGSMIIMGAGRLPAVKTPFGNLLVRPPFYLTLFVPSAKGQLPIPIPNDPGLTGLTLNWQSVHFNVVNQLNGTSNGTEWFLGN